MKAIIVLCFAMSIITVSVKHDIKNVKCLKNVIPRLIFSINLPKKYT